MRHPSILLALVALCGLLTTCVDAITPRLQLETGLYLVEGQIADRAGFSEIRVSRSELRSNSYFLVPIRDAIVTSIAGDGSEVVWAHDLDTDEYRPPADFVGTTGNSYFLRLQLSDGTLIESLPEVMQEAVPIAGARVNFEQEAYFSQSRNSFTPAFTLLADIDDPAGRPNFYQLRYRKWTEAIVCLSCPRRFRYRGGECEDFSRNFDVRWDYFCDGPCWNVSESTGINIFRDEFSDGNLVTNIEAGREDFVTGFNPGLLFEIQVLGITGEAFAYNRVFKEQAENGGGLNAPNPTALVGNLSIIGDEDTFVLGFVGTTAISTERIFIDRSAVDGVPIPNPLEIIEEPPTPFCADIMDCPPPAPAKGRAEQVKNPLAGEGKSA